MSLPLDLGDPTLDWSGPVRCGKPSGKGQRCDRKIARLRVEGGIVTQENVVMIPEGAGAYVSASYGFVMLLCPRDGTVGLSATEIASGSRRGAKELSADLSIRRDLLGQRSVIESDRPVDGREPSLGT